MVMTFCYLCQLMPGVKKHIFNPRQTDDKFVMVMEVTSRTTEEELKSFLASVGAEDINTQIAEAGWWYGRFDKEENLLELDPAAPVQA